ncbi:MAG: (Fe-S)-binding protein [Candidatus Bathyarchaeota archaeon]
MSKVNNCYQCGLCTGICPKRRISDYSPRSKINKFLLEDSKGESWKCLTCGLCSNYCPQEVDYLDFVRDLRKQQVDEEVIAHKSIFSLTNEIMNKYPNSQGVPTNFKGKIEENSDIAYFPGCIDFFDCFLDVGVNFHEIGESSIKLLNRIDIKPKILSLRCCGHDALWQGDYDTFIKLKKYNEEKIKKSGIKTLITSCAECFRTFSKDYELDIDVVHISQILDKNKDKLNIKTDNSTITYHDPCRLGRHMGIFDPPRNVLSKVKGLELKELDESREDAQCCGVSAWVSCNQEAKFMLVEKLEKAMETNSKTLITSCPKCLAHLNCVKNEKPPIKEFDIDVEDLTVYLSKLIDTK